jgi:RHS repeat-associated protein
MSLVTSYSWDEENRMIGVVNPDSSSESFTYAGDGQRRSKSTLSDLINYVWDGENVLQEVDGNTGEIKAHYTDYPGYWGGLTSLHTEGSTPGTTGAQFNAAAFGSAEFNQSSTSTSSGSFYYLFDLQASTRQLTDASGDVSDAYAYRAFGETELEQGSTRNPHRFQGQVGPYTDATVRVWMRARIYGTNTGQWLSRDPIEFRSGDTNFYGFVGNNTLRFFDPSGLDSCTSEPPDGVTDIPDFSNPAGGWYRSPTGLYCYDDRSTPKHPKPPETNAPSSGFLWPIPGVSYGRFCGPNQGATGRFNCNLPKSKGGPVDKMDKACCEHDNCYGNFKVAIPRNFSCPTPGSQMCDRDLCNAARDPNICSSYSWWDPRKQSCKHYAGSVALLFCANSYARDDVINDIYDVYHIPY